MTTTSQFPFTNQSVSQSVITLLRLQPYSDKQEAFLSIEAINELQCSV